ncbi:MarR family transcriptional regulator [Candidatus Bathyarchaeota archaeon]|nr:MAG: MarR family transcriptional regulator [Candidatus Bathyarchaeota archaeon]
MERRSEGGFLISKIHQLSGRIFNGLLREHGIEFNSAQGRILFVLWEKDSIPIKELSEKTQLSKSTLTSMLDRLERKGHITREPSEEDRRIILVNLTEENRRQRRLYDQVSEEMTGLFYEGFTWDEITEFEGYLKLILDNLVKRSD